MAAFLLALGAGAVFALGTVLQQREAMTESDSEAESATILLRLARHPVWLAGIAAYGVAYGMQATALGIGKLVVVQPTLATTIVFALPLGARLSAQRISRRDVVAAIVVTVALGCFLLASDPAGGRDDAPFEQWAVAGGIVVALAAALARTGIGRSGAVRAALLGTAAGLLFGLVSALTKGTVELLTDEGFAVLADWHVYALLVLGFGGMTLTQMALQAGVLPPAVATTSIVNPATSVLLGIVLFDETMHRSALGSAISTAALLVMFAGVATLAMSSGGAPSPARREAYAG
jgi:drug/metabolite transporter (DMT)-like permease